MPAAPLPLLHGPPPPPETLSPPGLPLPATSSKASLCSPRNTSHPTQRRRGEAELPPRRRGTGAHPRGSAVAAGATARATGRPFCCAPAEGTRCPPRRDLRPPAAQGGRRGRSPGRGRRLSSRGRRQRPTPAPPRDALPAGSAVPRPPPPPRPGLSFSLTHSLTPYFSCSVGIHMLAACVRPAPRRQRRWPASPSAAPAAPAAPQPRLPGPGGEGIVPPGGRAGRPTP